jgi:hypothetical protein
MTLRFSAAIQPPGPPRRRPGRACRRGPIRLIWREPAEPIRRAGDARMPAAMFEATFLKATMLKRT